MGFYSFGRIKIISRNSVKSAVATAAYHAAVKLTNEYDGVTHDHTRKKHVLATHIRMPEGVPSSWRDENLSITERLDNIWNTVEKNHSASNSQLARSNYLALQHNLTIEQNIECVERFIKENCTDRGMGTIYSLHLKPNNWHVDMMYLISEYDKKGKPKARAKKEYLCRNKDGEESYFDSEAIKKPVADGFEKVYKYQKDGIRKDMTPSEASELEGWERINKYPVCRTVKISGWDEHDLAKKWRKSWEVILNDKFAELGMPDRVDCRSFKEQGNPHLPTEHEGWGPASKEHKENNRQIKELNQEMDQLYDVGMAAVRRIEEQIDDLTENEQTEESLNEHEKNYTANELILSKIVHSEFLNQDDKQTLKYFLSNLSRRMYGLMSKVREQIKSRKIENIEVSEVSEETTGVTKKLGDILFSVFKKKPKPTDESSESSGSSDGGSGVDVAFAEPPSEPEPYIPVPEPEPERKENLDEKLKRLRQEEQRRKENENYERKSRREAEADWKNL